LDSPQNPPGLVELGIPQNPPEFVELGIFQILMNTIHNKVYLTTIVARIHVEYLILTH
jgi:hypothetical protein